MQLHGALDTLAARLAAEGQRDGRISPRQLAELQQTGRQMRKRAEQGDARGVWAANAEFHRCLTHLSGDPMLEDASEQILSRFAMVSLDNISRRLDLTPVAHFAIVGAIVAGDPERAAATAAEHVHEAAQMHARTHP